jgi:hypothetical protein
MRIGDPMRIGDIVDRDRYPIDAPSGAAALAEDARARLARDNLVLLPGFVRESARERMAAELAAALPGAYRRDRLDHGIHLYAGEAPPPPGHPLLAAPNRSAQMILAGDQIPADGCLWSLFRWDPLTDFVAACVGARALYRSADPLAALTATALGPGDAHGWHFDENDFVVSLIIQAPDGGGAFEILPDAKTDAGIDFDACAAALAGTSPRVAREALQPGTLSIFCGKRTLHRVSPVEGARPRLVALLSYDRQPGMVFSPDVHRGAFGRTLTA